MAPRRQERGPSEAEWERNKSDLRNLFLVEKKPMKELVEVMSKRGYKVTFAWSKSHVESRLKKWKFQRNMKEDGWRYIRHHLEKRKRAGKSSRVSLSGIVLDPVKVTRETERYRDVWMSRGVRSPTPGTPPDFAAMISTPPPSTTLTLYQFPPTMPWIKFIPRFDSFLSAGSRTRFQNPNTSLQHEANIATEELLSAILKQLFSSRTGKKPATGLEGPLGSILDLAIPGTQHGDSLSRTEIFLHGSSYEKARESLKVIIYYLSNNMVNLETLEGWRAFQAVIEETGLLLQPAPFNLSELDDDTISAFCDNLFVSLIHYFHEFRPYQHGFHHQLLRWLLQAGQDANRIMPYPDDPDSLNYAIGFATQCQDLQLVQLLLEFGAEPSLTDALWALLRQKYDVYDAVAADRPEGLVDYHLDMGDPQTDENRIAELLLNSAPTTDSIVNIEGCLLLSLQYGDIHISRRLCHYGANILAWKRAESHEYSGFMHSITALSAIAEYVPFPESWSQTSPPPIQFVVDMLQVADFDILSHEKMVAGAFISATLKQNHVTLRHLARIGGNINACNEIGVTALHASASLETPETCRLLLELGADPNCSAPGYPSPLLVACATRCSEIGRLLVSAGANVHHEVKPTAPVCSGIAGLRFGIMKNILTGSWKSTRSLRSPLEVLTRTCSEDARESVVSLSSVLLAAGAVPTAPVMVQSLEYPVTDLLEPCLLAGGDPNGIHHPANHSILSLALMRGKAPCALLLLQTGAERTWDDLCMAAAVVCEANDREQLKNALMEKLYQNGEDIGPPGSLYLRLFWDGGPRAIDGLFEFRPYDYCSLGLLLAVAELVDTEESDLRLIEFLLLQRNNTGRHEMEPDVFEAASVAVTAVSGNKSLLRILLTTFAPSRSFATSIRGPTLRKLDKAPCGLKSWIQNIVSQALYYPQQLKYRSPLYPSVAWGSEGTAIEMMELGYQPDMLCLREAIKHVRPSLVKRILSGCHASSTAAFHASGGPLYLAVETGSSDILQILLDEGFTGYETSPKNALCRAIQKGEESLVDMLLSTGIGIHLPAARPRQRTALQQAVELADQTVIRRLLDAGVDVNQAPAPSYGATALQLAAITGQVGIASLLIQHGADVNAPGSKVGGRTALEAAAEHGRLDMAQLLLESGFKTVGLGRIAYVKAVAYAEERCHPVLERLLRRHRTWSGLDEELKENLILDERHGTFEIDSDFTWWDDDLLEEISESLWELEEL